MTTARKGFLSLIILLTFAGIPVRAQDGSGQATGTTVLPDKHLATAIIDSWEERMRGDASRGEMEMYIQKWNRTLTMRFEELYPDRSLVRVLSPGSLMALTSSTVPKCTDIKNLRIQ
ncbi:hypothetical protein KBA39_04310 [Myxococcota bacterium]|nr:hypothetical protein [Myxococcota bacterium]